MSNYKTDEQLMIAACHIRSNDLDREPVTVDIGSLGIPVVTIKSLPAFLRAFPDYERDPDGYTFRKRIGSVIFEAVDLEAYKRERGEQ